MTTKSIQTDPHVKVKAGQNIDPQLLASILINGTGTNTKPTHGAPMQQQEPLNRMQREFLMRRMTAPRR